MSTSLLPVNAPIDSVNTDDKVEIPSDTAIVCPVTKGTCWQNFVLAHPARAFQSNPESVLESTDTSERAISGQFTRKNLLSGAAGKSQQGASRRGHNCTFALGG
ncbi:hypothetical protein [Arthrobacter sp. NPDC056727]|uniref:hypothetical protein n=1 Tax=Arthrobacter sp. NPDC056727 TaxID=3345927 RepID=UPI003671A950